MLRVVLTVELDVDPEQFDSCDEKNEYGWTDIVKYAEGTLRSNFSYDSYGVEVVSVTKVSEVESPEEPEPTSKGVEFKECQT